jgi:hypothetical protein
MATRVIAVRALAGLLTGLAVLAGVVLLARPTAPGAAPPAPGTVADQARAPSARAGELPPATSTPGAEGAAGSTPPAAAGPAADPCRLVTRAERDGAARFQVGLLDGTGQPASRRAPPGLLTLARMIAGRLR